MMDLQNSLAADTLLRISQAEQMACYLTSASEQLSCSALAWAKEMHWLQSACEACAMPFGESLNDRTRAVDAALSEALACRRDLQTRLARMWSIVAMRQEPAGAFLDRLGIGPGGIQLKSAKPNAIYLTKRKTLHLPFDLAMEQIAADVLDACAELQDCNARLEAALQGLPELFHA